MKRALKYCWRFARWVFPPYYIYLLLCGIWRLVTWPFRTIKRKLFGRGLRFKGNKKLGRKWAEAWLDTRIGRPLVDIIFDTIKEKQGGYSYISAETLACVGERVGLTLEEVVFILASERYRWTWSIQDWEGLSKYFGVDDEKKHRNRDRRDDLIELHYGQLHPIYR